MPSKIEQLRELKLFNDHDFFEHGEVWLFYRPAERMHSSCWIVYRKGFKTDPDGPWYNYGNKAFLGFESRSEIETRRAAGLREAKEWCKWRYGITEWARTPWGSYADANIVKPRLKELLG